MRALLVVDIQQDFLPGGALAVMYGDEIIPVVNELMNLFEIIIATQDWHPADHGSFASEHAGKKPGDFIQLNELEQILWPVHCVQNSKGAQFSNDLNTGKFQKVVTKGTDRIIDSYSGFFDNGHLKSTGLNDYLRSIGVTDLYITGLATDYCVKFTALDAADLGFNTFLIKDATRAVNLAEGDFEKAIEEMSVAGVKIINSSDILQT